MDRQAEDRAHRIGQKDEVRIYRLITNSRVEEGILNKAEEKKDLDNIIIQAGMFNNQATEQARQQKLQEMMTIRDGEVANVNEDEENENDEVFTDEQLNEVISRNDEEYELFNRMDQERYKLAEEKKAERIALIREKKPWKANLPDEKINYRLIQDWEVPQWIITSVTEEVKVDPFLSLGKRKRAEVNYKEQVSDAQYFKMIEAGLDPNLESDVKRARRQQVVTPPESPVGAGDDSVPHAAVAKKGLQKKNSAEDKEIQNNDDIIVSENEDEKAASDPDEDFVVGTSKSKGKNKK